MDGGNRRAPQRGRELEGVLKQYTRFVKPSFEHYIAPLMAHADIIVPRGGDNEVAISLIVQHVQTQLQLVNNYLCIILWTNSLFIILIAERVQIKTHFSQCSSGPIIT